MNRNFVIERNVKRRRRVIPVSMNCQLVVSQSPSMTVTVNVGAVSEVYSTPGEGGVGHRGGGRRRAISQALDKREQNGSVTMTR